MINNNQQNGQTKKIFKKDDAYQTLEIINLWIGNIDTKVSFALAFVGVLIGSIFKEGLPNAFQEIESISNIYKTEITNISAAILVILLYGTSLLAIIYFILAITARVQAPTQSLFFFGSISKMQLNEYKNKANEMDEQELIEDLEEQIHINSCICSLKVSNYNKGLKCLIATIGIWFICMIFQLI